MHKKPKRKNREEEQEFDKKPRLKYDEEISSSEDESNFVVDADNLYPVSDLSDEEDSEELPEPTPVLDQKESIDELRVKQASEMLEKIKDIVGDIDQDDSKESEDPILMRLRLEEKRMNSRVPPGLKQKITKMQFSQDNLLFLKGHKKAPTCICLAPDDQFVFTGAKDGCIIKWDILNRSKQVVKNVHKGHILAVAITTDGKLLATGGRDKKIVIFDASTMKPLQTWETAHSGDVYCLAFQMGTHQLFSGSSDRTIKVWDCDEMAFVEALYGHESSIYGVDAMFSNAAVSCGQDQSLRYWKVETESQLIMKGQKESIGSMGMFNDSTFFTGSEDGSLALWNKTKKKPKFVFPNAHGGKWICSVATFKFADIAASGSSDGFLKFWNCGDGDIKLINQIPVNGYLSGMEFSKSGKFLVAVCAQDHRFGRWGTTLGTKVKNGTKNGIIVYKF